MLALKGSSLSVRVGDTPARSTKTRWATAGVPAIEVNWVLASRATITGRWSLLASVPGLSLSSTSYLPGGAHSAGITSDGNPHNWGAGDSGQLGSDDDQDVTEPVIPTP